MELRRVWFYYKDTNLKQPKEEPHRESLEGPNGKLLCFWDLPSFWYIDVYQQPGAHVSLSPIIFIWFHYIGVIKAWIIVWLNSVSISPFL